MAHCVLLDPELRHDTAHLGVSRCEALRIAALCHRGRFDPGAGRAEISCGVVLLEAVGRVLIETLRDHEKLD